MKWRLRGLSCEPTLVRSICPNTCHVFDNFLFRPDHLLFYVEVGEEGRHNEAMAKAFEIKMKQSEKVAKKLARVSGAIQKTLQRRGSEPPARDRTSRKRVFADTDHDFAMLDSSVASATKRAKKRSDNKNGEGDTMDISDPKAFVGRKVAKFFGQDLFLGKVTEYLPYEKEGLAIWTVEYDDGDQEDYELKELLELIDLHRQYERGELDVVELEDEDNMESNGV